jgi:hypothetical protein
MIHLGDRYLAAATDAERARIVAAAEAVLATDVWHATGGLGGGICLMSAAISISVAMLQSGLFGKVTAYGGILANALDLARVLIDLVARGNPEDILMAVAGPSYLLWFVPLGRRLLQLGRPIGEGLPQPA